MTDALGRRVALSRPPRRIVSLVPSLTETLFAFGCGERLIAVTQFCVEPRAETDRKEKVGGTKTLDVPKILSLEPDLVVASAEENRREEVEALMQHGLTVYVTLPVTVRAAIDLLSELAMMVDASAAAGEIISEAEETMTQVQIDAAKRPPVSVFCPIWRNPYMTIGPGTYMHDLLAVCGGENIFSGCEERYPSVALEEVALRNPQVILLPSEPYRFRERHKGDFAGFEGLAARADGRIHLVDGRSLCWYGPRIASGLRTVASLLTHQDVRERRRPEL